MKLRKSKFPTRLSEIVQQTLYTEYPQLVSVKIDEGWINKVKGVFPKSCYLALILFLVGVALNEFFIWQGWIISGGYKLDSQGAADILASSLEYLAGLVGIVLPIILIIIEFISEDKGTSSLVNIYLERTGLKTTAILALIILGVEAVLMTIFRADIIKLPQALLYLIYFLTLLNLAAIFETGKTIFNLSRSLSNSFLVETLSAKLRAEIEKSQKLEVEYRIGRIVNLEVYQRLGLDRSGYGQQPQNTSALLAANTGVIEDIHLPELNKFARQIKTSLEQVCMAKIVNDSVQAGEAIAYIPLSMNGHTEELQRSLERIYIVGKAGDALSVNDTVKTLLTQVGHTVETSIREEDKPFFDELMSVYRLIFALGVRLPLPPSTEWLSNILFRGWTANQIAIRHMRDFVETAARSKNRDFIEGLSYEIYKIAGLMIRNCHVTVDENFSEVLSLYVTMYTFSNEYQNELGIHRSYFYLTRDIIDRLWVDSLNNASKELRAVQNHRVVFNTILGTLSQISKQALLKDDLNTFRTVLNFMQPHELLAHYRLDHSVAHEYVLLLQRREVSNEIREDFEEVIEALKLVKEIPNYAQEFFNYFTTLVTSYIFESYARDDITIGQFEGVIAILEPYSLPVEQTLKIFSELLSNDSLLGRSLFTRHPDTKRGFFPNDEEKLFLFCCLRGMTLLRKEEINLTLALDFQSDLSRIQETCNQIIKNSSKWIQTSLFLGFEETNLSELAQRWMNFINNVNKRWQENLNDQIIDADLDTSKVDIFKDGVKNAIRNSSRSSFRQLLDVRDRINGNSNSSKRIHFVKHLPKKHFTKLHEDNSFASSLGEQYGNLIVRRGDFLLVQSLISNSRSSRTRKEWENFKSYFDHAIDRFSKSDKPLSCFLVPNNPNLYQWLRKTPNFVENDPLALAEKLPMLAGCRKSTL